MAVEGMDWLYYVMIGAGGLVALALLSLYWKPFLVLFFVMLTSYEPSVGIPTAFVVSFSALLWIGREEMNFRVVVDAFKFAVLITILAIVVGFILNHVFDGSGGYEGGCSRANPAGC